MNTVPALWPRLLPPGGTIGICSPSGPTENAPDALARAARELERRGYRVVIAPHAGGEASADGKPYLAGSDAARLADLNGFLADPAVDLILCARGGYGAARLLGGLDYAAAQRDPKPLVGYSDVTALNLALLARANVVSFSGLMATAGHGFGEESLDAWSASSFFAAVGAQKAWPRVLEGRAPGSEAWQVHQAKSDTVSGRLVPVCLALLVSLVGTPFVPDLTGAVLVIEDVHEDLYAVDRCLTQLRLAGLLEGLAGVLVGSFNGTPGQDELLRREVPRLVCELTPPHIAVASGVAYGHIARRLTLPVGAAVSVDLHAETFTFLGPAA